MAGSIQSGDILGAREPSRRYAEYPIRDGNHSEPTGERFVPDDVQSDLTAANSAVQAGKLSIAQTASPSLANVAYLMSSAQQAYGSLPTPSSAVRHRKHRPSIVKARFPGVLPGTGACVDKARAFRPLACSFTKV